MSPSVSIRLLSTQSDARLLELAQAGHERAFEALVRRYRRPLLAHCRRLLLSDERAEDALQQALLQAWLALRSGTEVANAKSWLHRIVHNAALNALRVSGYDYCKLSESLSGSDAPQADLDRRIAVREALAGLAALPEMQREALLRTAVEGDSHQQVARDLGLSEPALRGLVYRARTSLRAAVGALMPPPLLNWALSSGARGTTIAERIGELGLGGGSAGVAGMLVKGGAVAVTAGALAGGIGAVRPHRTVTVERSSPRPAQIASSRQPGPAAAVAQANTDVPASLRSTTRPPDSKTAPTIDHPADHHPEHRQGRRAIEASPPPMSNVHPFHDRGGHEPDLDRGPGERGHKGSKQGQGPPGHGQGPQSHGRGPRDANHSGKPDRRQDDDTSHKGPWSPDMGKGDHGNSSDG